MLPWSSMHILTSPYLWILLFLVGGAVPIIYYLHQKHTYWLRRGVPFIPASKLLSQFVRLMLGRLQVRTIFEEFYVSLAGHKFGGSYQLTRPTLILRDPELIRSCLINNFSCFHDHQGVAPCPKVDPLSHNLYQLTGEQWHQVRQKVAQAFSSAKLRLMYQTLQGCAERLDAHILRLCSEGEKEEIELCAKELMGNFSMEIIAASALGIKSDAIQDPNDELKRMMDRAMVFSWSRFFGMLVQLLSPRLVKLLGLRSAEKEVEEFFERIIRDTVQMKSTAEGETRKDFLQILVNLRHAEQNNPQTAADVSVITDDVMMGVVSAFLAVGYDAVAVVFAFCLFEVAHRPDVQDKMFQELQSLKTPAAVQLPYDQLKNLQYMEQVISETLRKYPVSVVLGRTCTEPFRIPGTSVLVEEGVDCFIPILSLHHDPKYFPNPEVFDPDRFSDENLHNIVPGSYLPFGDGPRACVAYRLVILYMKTMLMTMVSNYTIHRCSRTPKELKYDGGRFFLTPKGDLWLRLRRRK
ncbi:unnamed protein product [Bemisia tabaci]|uniref:Cytochrome P450 n=2 Tax=Bemisia tabaci TaxID=7038 RepID=A0A9P0A8P9_BEMTA|nr:unnamed protein product [Bemisia tabaci]